MVKLYLSLFSLGSAQRYVDRKEEVAGDASTLLAGNRNFKVWKFGAYHKAVINERGCDLRRREYLNETDSRCTHCPMGNMYRVFFEAGKMTPFARCHTEKNVDDLNMDALPAGRRMESYARRLELIEAKKRMLENVYAGEKYGNGWKYLNKTTCEATDNMIYIPHPGRCRPCNLNKRKFVDKGGDGPTVAMMCTKCIDEYAFYFDWDYRGMRFQCASGLSGNNLLATFSPTVSPTKSPTISPTVSPTKSPTKSPTISPTISPTKSPTKSPTISPTENPTKSPTKSPTISPTENPTKSPTKSPTISPTENPTKSPTKSPTISPTENPTKSPTKSPTISPTENPTKSPTKSPTISPTENPTKSPTKSPTISPTENPTKSPTKSPTISPTENPTKSPTKSPTISPTENPTKSPTKSPTISPTENPTKSPTKSPTISPTENPTKSPTKSPTISPTENPTKSPTKSPTVSPTENPTKSPTKSPTISPTENPTKSPTKSPTISPTENPTKSPTKSPTISPTVSPTENPTKSPTKSPTVSPTTVSPTVSPTWSIFDTSNALGTNNLIECAGACQYDGNCEWGFECYRRQQGDGLPNWCSGSVPPGDNGTDVCWNPWQHDSSFKSAYIPNDGAFDGSECQGGCTLDSDCQQGLVCFERHHAGDLLPHGCYGSTGDTTNYCAVPRYINRAEDITSTSTPAHGADSHKLRRCEGSCQSSADCEDGLKCWKRYNESAKGPPECTHGEDVPLWNYCYKLDPACDPDQPTPVLYAGDSLVFHPYDFDQDCNWTFIIDPPDPTKALFLQLEDLGTEPGKDNVTFYEGDGQNLNSRTPVGVFSGELANGQIRTFFANSGEMTLRFMSNGYRAASDNLHHHNYYGFNVTSYKSAPASSRRLQGQASNDGHRW